MIYVYNFIICSVETSWAYNIISRLIVGQDIYFIHTLLKYHLQLKQTVYI